MIWLLLPSGVDQGAFGTRTVVLPDDLPANLRCPDRAISDGTTLLYIGSDVDFAVLHYLEDTETLAVYIELFEAPEAKNHLRSELANFDEKHENDTRLSWRQSTRQFRPWRDSYRSAFSRFVMARLIDEGFDDVCLIAPLEFGFTARGIRRRLTFRAGELAAEAKAACEAHGAITTLVLIGIDLAEEVHKNPCTHLERVIYTHTRVVRFSPWNSPSEVKRVTVWGTEYAVKIFKPDELRDFKEEVRVLEHLRHPNIVAFYGAVTRDSAHHAIIQELCTGSVYDYLQKFGSAVKFPSTTGVLELPLAHDRREVRRLPRRHYGQRHVLDHDGGRRPALAVALAVGVLALRVGVRH